MTMNPVVHFEMPYEDRTRMADFYTKAFGWKAQMLGADMGEYVVVHTGETDENNMVKTLGTINGGLYKKNPDNNTVSVVVSVDDIHESMRKVNESGGSVLGEPVEIPGIGHYVSFKDTEGNKVAMLQPLPRQ